MKLIREVQKTATEHNIKNAQIEWQTSYNYTTKTSAKRGGYSRIRRSYYQADDQGMVKPSWVRWDELTGEYSANNNYWSIPIPIWYQDQNLILVNKYGISIKVKDLKYCGFYGSLKSAEFLSSFGDDIPKDAEDRAPDSINARFIDWLSLFPYQERLKYWVAPTRTITIADGKIVSDIAIACPKHGDFAIRPISTIQQLSLL